MPRKGENIYKRKDGRWEGRYIRSYDSEHKAKYAYVYGKTYSEVKRKLTEQRGNVQKVQPNEGILISNPAKGTFYAEVYIYFESDGHRVYSDACRALLSNEPQKDVFYTLKYKKAGLFSKKCTLYV